MAVRILSVIIIPNSSSRSSGSATIDFYGHHLSGDIEQPSGSDKSDLGPNELFNREPCKIVPLRRIKFSDQDHSRPSEARVDAKDFDLTDDFVDRQRVNSLKVSWSTKGKRAGYWKFHT